MADMVDLAGALAGLENWKCWTFEIAPEFLGADAKPRRK